MDKPNRRVIIKGVAGFGNRMRFLAHAVIYALATGRTLVVDWRDKVYSDERKNSLPYFFSIEGVPTADLGEGYAPAASVYPAVWSDDMERTIPEWRRAVKAADPAAEKDDIYRVMHRDVGLLEFDRPEETVILWSHTDMVAWMPDAVKEGLFGTADAKDVMRMVFARHIRLRPEIARLVDGYAARHFTGRRVVAVHVRDSDKRPDSPLASCLGLVKAELSIHPDARIFLATDNRDAEDIFRKEFGPERILVTDKWYPEPGKSAHQNKACPDRRQNGVEALVDMYLLGRADVLIAQKGSTFSAIAPFLAEKPPHLIQW